MHHNIAQFFQLKGYLVDGWKIQKKRVEIKVRVARKTQRCPKCNHVCKRIHQRHVREVLHTFTLNKKIVLLMTKRRFKCRCNKIFTEVPPGMKRYGRRTRFQYAQELKDLVFMGFEKTSSRHGVSASTVWRDLQAAPLEKGIVWRKRGDIRLGIDGHSYQGKKMAMTIVDITRKPSRPLTILPTDSKADLEAFFQGIPRDISMRIVEVCIDMDTGSANAIRAYLPYANIVADHFHVIQMANRLIDEVRRVLQENNKRIPKKAWLKNKEHLRTKDFETIIRYGELYPKLFDLWRLKEDLRRVYDMHNKRVAAHRLKKVIEGYEHIQSGYARSFAGTLKKWRKEILNFFDNRTTNASTESHHQKFKLIQHTSFGFRNINSYIAKLTLSFVPLWLVLHHTI